MSLKLTDLQNRIGQLNNTNDTVAGGNTAGGTGYSLYSSLLGVELELDNAAAKQLSYITTGTLYAGLYRYMRVCSTTTGSMAIGSPVFYTTTQAGGGVFLNNDGSQYTVWVDASASLGDGMFAGVGLQAITLPTASRTVSTAALLAAATTFTWIQSSGLCTILYKNSPADTTVGDLVTLSTGTLTFDSIADASAIATATLAKNTMGVAIQAAASAVTKVALIWPRNVIY
jgi:hypothetical protein